jgi:hypothetical protein
MKTTGKILVALMSLIILLVACNKQGQTGTMTVKMKDNPIEFEAVFVDVLRVEVQHSNGSGASGWMTLETEAGIYDLLSLQNGITATLSNNVTIPVGKVNQMRLILGSQNSVQIEGQTFPLLLSSQDETGLKFNLNASINEGQNVEVLFDFDAEKSIVLGGNGSFRLKPVIKVESVIYN